MEELKSLVEVSLTYDGNLGDLYVSNKIIGNENDVEKLNITLDEITIEKGNDNVTSFKLKTFVIYPENGLNSIIESLLIKLENEKNKHVNHINALISRGREFASSMK